MCDRANGDGIGVMCMTECDENPAGSKGHTSTLSELHTYSHT